MLPSAMGWRFLHLLIFNRLVSAVDSCTCKAYPGSPSWPAIDQWNSLNSTLEGGLLKPLPPAAVCHPSEPDFNKAACAYVASQWNNSAFHAGDPISVDSSNWSKDCCLPDPSTPCSDKGYPSYVVKATKADDVAAGIKFARDNNVRLVVKGTGHDYLGRSIAPNSLSIWTHHMRGLQLHDSFTPQGCPKTHTKAITVAAGEQIGDIYEYVAKFKQTVVGGTSATVGVGGYFTGGGHSPLSASFGLGVDQVLEIEAVTADGQIVTANECQSTDLFWALRGGGGATFAVITSITLKTFPTMPISTFHFNFLSPPDSSAYWKAITYLLSQYRHLVDSGVNGYVFSASSAAGDLLDTPKKSSGYTAVFFSPKHNSAELEKIFTPILSHINTTWPELTLLGIASKQHPDFISFWPSISEDQGVGENVIIGNRLLDYDALSLPLDDLEQAMRNVSSEQGILNLNIIGGPGVWNAKPQGGSDSVSPAWRRAYLEFISIDTWPFLDNAAQAKAESNMVNKYLPALQKLAGPDAGCYSNEDYPYDPWLNEAFWGSNYPRLLDIKRQLDPDDVFWCQACVGHESWKESSDGRLCRV